MRIIVVGGGDTGVQLIDRATADGHDVIAIEHDDGKAEAIAAEYDCQVVNADATVKATWEEAEAEHADAVIVTTDDDSVNIMVCLLAQEFAVPTIVSVVHNAAHRSLYRQINVTTVENPQQLIAEDFYRSVKHPALVNWTPMGDHGEVVEIQVVENAPLAGHTLKEAGANGLIPGDVLIIAIKRPDTDSPLVPSGNTRILPNDLITVYTANGITDKVTAMCSR